MNKGGRKTRYNLRQKFQALSSSSGKKKVKHSAKYKQCTCSPEYFDLVTAIYSCTCHDQDNTALSSHQRVSPSILKQDPTSYFATQAEHTGLTSQFATQSGQASPSTSPLAAQTEQRSSTGQFATQAGQPSPLTSQFATQAGRTSPIASYFATLVEQLRPSTSPFATQAGPPSPPASPLTSLLELPTSNPLNQLPERSPPLDSTPDLTVTSDSESETDNEDETTPLLSLRLRKTKSFSPTDKAKTRNSSDDEDKEYI